MKATQSTRIVGYAFEHLTEKNSHPMLKQCLKILKIVTNVNVAIVYFIQVKQ